MFQIKKAQRKNVKLKLGLFGPSGSGKTMSALKLAKGLVGDWERVAVLDTENDSAELYSDLGDFLHCPFPAPHSPQRYIEAIKYISENADIDCLIIDSISHEWAGTGGCIDIVDNMGGKFNNWAKVTPLHQQFITAIMSAPFHVVVTGRTKTDYVVDRDERNKTKIEKVGLKAVTREGFDYELSVAFYIDANHRATTDKDRTGLFSNSIPFLIDESIGEKIREWNNSGAPAPINYKTELLKKIKQNNNNDNNAVALAFGELGVTRDEYGKNNNQDFWAEKFKQYVSNNEEK